MSALFKNHGKWLSVAAVGLAMIAITALVIITFGAADKASKHHGGLVCEEDSYNFGELTLEEAVLQEHTFYVINTSDHPIRIVKKSSTCGCTVAELPENAVIAAGEVMEIPVRADWGGKAGTQGATVALSTDEPNAPVVRLHVAAFIKAPAILRPDSINFGLLKPGQRATRTVELLQGTDPRAFRITAMENPSEYISVSRLAQRAGEKGGPLVGGGPGKLALSITAPRTTGRENADIVFRTDLEDRPEVRLWVEAQFAGALTAVPRSVLFAKVSSEDTILKEVRVRSSAGSQASEPEMDIVWDGEGPNPFFIEKITQGSNSDRPALHVTVGFKRKEVKQSFNRAVLRVTSGPDSLDIPIMAMGRHKDQAD